MPALPATSPLPTAANAGGGATSSQPEVAARSPFSLLLGGASAPAEASAPAGLLPGVETDTAGDGTPSESGAETDQVLPDHLLGLLDGSWLTPATPASAPVAAAPGVSSLPGAHAPGLAMPSLQAGPGAPPLPTSASLAMAIRNAASGADASTPAHAVSGFGLATTRSGPPATMESSGSDAVAAQAPAVALPLLPTASATIAALGENSASGADAALAQALPPSATPQPAGAQATAAGAAFETLIHDAAGATPADSGGIEPAPLTAPTAATTTSLSALRASPLAQPLPMPADPSAGFDDGLSTRIAWMAEQGIGRAELRVNPDHAGPIEVRLQMEGTRLVAEFSAVNADTRQALEAGMHRLRDMLGQQGLQLAQSHVGSGGGQGRQDGSSGGTAGGARPADGSDIAAGDTAPARWVSRGLLDEYA